MWFPVVVLLALYSGEHGILVVQDKKATLVFETQEECVKTIEPMIESGIKYIEDAKGKADQIIILTKQCFQTNTDS